MPTHDLEVDVERDGVYYAASVRVSWEDQRDESGSRSESMALTSLCAIDDNGDEVPLPEDMPTEEVEALGKQIVDAAIQQLSDRLADHMEAKLDDRGED